MSRSCRFNSSQCVSFPPSSLAFRLAQGYYRSCCWRGCVLDGVHWKVLRRCGGGQEANTTGARLGKVFAAGVVGAQVHSTPEHARVHWVSEAGGWTFVLRASSSVVSALFRVYVRKEKYTCVAQPRGLSMYLQVLLKTNDLTTAVGLYTTAVVGPGHALPRQVNSPHVRSPRWPSGLP